MTEIVKRESPDRKEALEKIGLAEADLVFQVAEDRPLQLHPGFQAAIAEQLQFDGDIPELRTSPEMPEGATPAVPVETSARNPVMVGAQLEAAQEEVAGLMAAEDTSAVSMYRAGHKAPILPAKSETSILTLSLKDAARYAFKAVTSTQGRKSLTPVIQAELVKALENVGVEARLLVGEAEETRVWDQFLPSGSGDYNPKFSVVDVAVATFKAHVLAVAGSSASVRLRVETFAKVADRRFGWALGFALDTKRDS